MALLTVKGARRIIIIIIIICAAAGRLCSAVLHSAVTLAAGPPLPFVYAH
jgi:hypothetical protein